MVAEQVFSRDKSAVCFTMTQSSTFVVCFVVLSQKKISLSPKTKKVRDDLARASQLLTQGTCDDKKLSDAELAAALIVGNEEAILCGEKALLFSWLCTRGRRSFVGRPLSVFILAPIVGERRKRENKDETWTNKK